MTSQAADTPDETPTRSPTHGAWRRYFNTLPLLLATLLLYAPSLHTDARLTLAGGAALAFASGSWLIWRLLNWLLSYWLATVFSVLLLCFALVDFITSQFLGLHANFFLLSLLLAGGPYQGSSWFIGFLIISLVVALLALHKPLAPLSQALPRPRWALALMMVGIGSITAQLSYVQGFLTGDPKVLTSAQDMALFWTPHPYQMRKLAKNLGLNVAHDNAYASQRGAAVKIQQIDKAPLQHAPRLAVEPRPNIAFIIIDSLRAQSVPVDGLIKNSQEIAGRNRAIYAASNCTHFSMYSIYYGDTALGFAGARDMLAMRSNRPRSGSPLVRGLAARGYDQRSFEAHSLDWYDSAEIVFAETVPRQIQRGGSAQLRDNAALSGALQFLTAQDTQSPRFAHIYLYGTHYPYAAPVDGSGLRARYETASKRAGTALSEFVQRLEKDNFFENGLVVFTSDHGEEFPEDRPSRTNTKNTSDKIAGHSSRLSDAQLLVPLQIIGTSRGEHLPHSHLDLMRYILAQTDRTAFTPAATPIISANCGYHWPSGLAAIWPNENGGALKVPFMLDRGSLLPAIHPEGHPLTPTDYDLGLSAILPHTQRLRRRSLSD